MEEEETQRLQSVAAMFSCRLELDEAELDAALRRDLEKRGDLIGLLVSTFKHDSPPEAVTESMRQWPYFAAIFTTAGRAAISAALARIARESLKESDGT